MPYRVLPYIKGTDMNDEILKIYRGTAYAKIVASTYHPYAPTIRQFMRVIITGKEKYCVSNINSTSDIKQLQPKM